MKSLCDRALLLDHGWSLAQRHARRRARLLQRPDRPAGARRADRAERAQGAAASSPARATAAPRSSAVEMTDAAGRRRDARSSCGETAVLRCSIRFDTRRRAPDGRLRLPRPAGQRRVRHQHLSFERLRARAPAGARLLDGDLSRCASTSATERYSVSVAVHTDATHVEENFDWWDQAAGLPGRARRRSITSSAARSCRSKRRFAGGPP